MGGKNSVNKLARRYRIASLWTIGILMLGSLLTIQVSGCTTRIQAVLISVVYSFCMNLASGRLWAVVAKRSVAALGKFYLAATVARFLIGSLVVLVYCLLVRDRTQIIGFAIIFSIFHVAMSAFDTVYYFMMERKLKLI